METNAVVFLFFLEDIFLAVFFGEIWAKILRNPENSLLLHL